MIEFKKITNHKTCYELDQFKPITINNDFLVNIGIDYPITEEVNAQLLGGSEWYLKLFENKALNPESNYILSETDPEKELEVHNYTGICPNNVLEVSPSEGSCSIGCQYCLVTDGNHTQKINVFRNYDKRLANSLERNWKRNIFYYFSPKTEAFSEPFLYEGVAHNIIRTFIEHFNKHPESQARIFIATKAGMKHLEIKHKGDSLISLMLRIPSKIQVNGSIGIMPDYLRDILEPNAASISERLEALRKLREVGIFAESVLCQPLFLPYLSNESISEFIQQLSAAGVKNIKPEFFTAEIRNIVLVSQYINYYDPEKVKEFLYPYLMESNLNNIKQRARLAPDREICAEKLKMIHDIAYNNGISISICNWVKREIGNVAEWVKNIDTESAAAGYRCLGYQTHLFER